jgi:hypothetical protein
MNRRGLSVRASDRRQSRRGEAAPKSKVDGETASGRPGDERFPAPVSRPQISTVAQENKYLNILVNLLFILKNYNYCVQL